MALKVVRVPQGCDERQLQKLLREGRIQGWIKHPNVIEVFETRLREGVGVRGRDLEDDADGGSGCDPARAEEQRERSAC
jgi:hypothetical protein